MPHALTTQGKGRAESQPARQGAPAPAEPQRASLETYQQTVGNRAVLNWVQRPEADTRGPAPPPILQRTPNQLQRKSSCASCPAQLEPEPAILPVQAKLSLSRPGDANEREADQVADQILRMPEPQVQRKCAACGGGDAPCPKCAADEEQVNLKATANSATHSPKLPAPLLNLGPGRALEPAVRSFFEPRFGRDMSHVRVHADEPQATESARAIGAEAFAYQNHIAFAPGRYDPVTTAGKKLLAHEITHVFQQTGQVARQPSQPTNVAQPSCTTGVVAGSARSAPHDYSRGPSGAYVIWGPRYTNESAATYSDLSIAAWIRWRFGTLSAAVAARIRAETTHWDWTWQPPDFRPTPGCQYTNRISIDAMNRLVALASRDPAARQAETRETRAGMPTLPSPAPLAGEEVVAVANASDSVPNNPVSQLDPQAEAEQALDPTSIYEAGVAGANLPPFPARIEGPEMEVPRGVGTFNMALDYAATTSDPLLQIAYHMSLVNYHWELYDVTQVVHAGLGRAAQNQARRTQPSPQAAEAANGATRQRAEHAYDELSEETIQSWQELRDPRRAAEGGSAIDVLTRTWANNLNLTLLPASAIIAAGGQAVSALSDLMGGYSQEREIALPNREGFYMVRCIAQPAPRGPNQSERRAASVQTKIVEVRSPEKLTRNTLESAGAALAELELRKEMTSDPAERQRLDAEIARLQEQTSGDLVTYLRHLVEQKQREYDAAPRWGRGRLARELESLQLRLEQAQRHREGTIGVPYRPQAAFTSFITGETYPLVLELSEVPAKDGYRVRLVDLTVPDREPIERNGATLGQALRNAFNEFAFHGELGRGQLLVRMPATWSAEPRELSLQTGYANTAIVRRRLQDLATALMVLSLAVPGVGEVSAILAAGLAVERLIRRSLNKTLRLDAESISDTFAILGAVAQGAQLVGRLRIVRQGRVFIATTRTGDAAAIQSAAAALENARRARKILDAASTVANVGGLIWGDLASLSKLAQLQQDELDGRITHAEARRQRAEILGAAIRDHGIVLHGALLPRGADRAAGAVPRPGEHALPPERASTGRENETIPEPELARRAREGAGPQSDGQPAQPRPDNVRARFSTPDNLHEIFILNDGRIFRCSPTCAQLRTWYDVYLKSQPEGTRKQAAAQLDGTLQILEARTARGENTPELNQAIGALDVSLREFVASDVTRELQHAAEGSGLVGPGERLLTTEQTRRLLRYFNVDEIQSLAGPHGLSSAEAIRRFANHSDAFLQGVKDARTHLGRSAEQIARALEHHSVASEVNDEALLATLNAFRSEHDVATLGTVIDHMASGEPARTRTADFMGRVTRIREVDGVHFDLTELYAAHLHGDAILHHGPLQRGEFLNDVVGERAMLGEGRLDVGTSRGRMPERLSRNPVIDFVILENEGTFHLVLGWEHSGLSRGRANVFAAGELRLDRNGIVQEVTRRSGHYRPSPENLLRAVEFMYDRNILSPQRPVRVILDF